MYIKYDIKYTKKEIEEKIDDIEGKIGRPYGIATLDKSGLVPTSQLPSYVDDVIEYKNFSSFPSKGETGKIYVDTATNKIYRWSGTTYVEIPKTIQLGETSSSAYPGNKGKNNADSIADIKEVLNSVSDITKIKDIECGLNYVAINTDNYTKKEDGTYATSADKKIIPLAGESTDIDDGVGVVTRWEREQIYRNFDSIEALQAKIDNVANVAKNTTYSFIIDQRGTITDPDDMVSDPFVINSDGSRTYIKKATDPEANEYENLMLWLKNNTHAYYCTEENDVLTLKQLSDTNRRKYKDGSDINLNKDYNIFIKFPCDVYYKSEAIIPPGKTEVNDDYILITFSIDAPTEEDKDNWNKWDQYKLIGVYPATLGGTTDSPKFTTKTACKPYSGSINSIYNKLNILQGTNFSCYDYHTHKFIVLLFYAYYCTLDSKNTCGCGTTITYSNSHYPKINGINDELGMTDTNNTTGTGANTPNSTNIINGYGNDIKAVNFWGLENLWGNIQEYTISIHTMWATAQDSANDRDHISEYLTTHSSIEIVDKQNNKITYTTYTSKEEFLNKYYNGYKDAFIAIHGLDENNNDCIVRAIYIGTTYNNSEIVEGQIAKLYLGKHADIVPKSISSSSSYDKNYTDRFISESHYFNLYYAMVRGILDDYVSNTINNMNFYNNWFNYVGIRLIYNGNKNNINIIED